jgi:DNA-binding CsgD family transcriptional regulator
LDIQDMAALGLLSPLSPVELAVYSHAVERAGIREGEPALEGISQEEVERAVQGLLERRLLVAVGTADRQLVAASPEAASDELAEPVARQARFLRAAADRLRDELTPVYERGLARRLRRPAVEELHSVDAVRDQLTKLAAQSQFEVLTSQPGGARDESVLQESMRRTEELLRRGVRMRTLYQHTAQFSSTTSAYVEIVTRLGAEVRTLGDGFMRMIAFDRKVAVIELRDNPQGALVISEPSIARFVIDTFDYIWAQAEEFPSDRGRDQAIFASDKAKEDIVRLLVLGEQDKVIARRMGMTVRTCQRHIAKIMERIGAKSRVHAGYLLREYDGDLSSALPPDRVATERAD